MIKIVSTKRTIGIGTIKGIMTTKGHKILNNYQNASLNGYQYMTF